MKILTDSGKPLIKNKKIYASDKILDTSDATATSNDLLKGKTAYVKGKKITGIIESSGGIIPSGTKDITSLGEIDVTEYASAQVVDDDLKPENIKKDVNILGVKGILVENGIIPSGTKDLTKNGSYDVREFSTVVVNVASSSVTTLKALLDATGSCYQIFSDYEGESVDNLISYNDTENVWEMGYMFFRCDNLKSVPLLNTANVSQAQNMFYYCIRLTAIPAFNFSFCENMTNMFASCSQIVRMQMYGMRANFDISPCTKLTKERLIEIFSNCQVVTSQTITLGNTLKNKLSNVYVKETGAELYEGITCRPCVECSSTDVGAKLAITYMNEKGWTVA
jgi:hypothetical protein